MGNNDFNVNSLNASGDTLMRRALDWAAADTVLLVVNDPNALTVEESAIRSILQSWSYQVALIASTASQASYNAAIATADVAYIPEEITSGDVNTKLRYAAIGIVNEEGQLVDELGLASQGCGFASASNLTISTNRHYITAPFSPGAISIFSSSQGVNVLIGSGAPGRQVLGTWSGQSSCIVLEVGDALWGGGLAAGRRVHLPWAGDNLDVNWLTANGRALMRRAVEWAAMKPNRYWSLRTAPFNNATHLAFAINTGNGVAVISGTTGPVDPNKLSFAAASYDGTTVRLYKDGVEVASLPLVGAVVDAPGTSAWIGNGPEAQSGAEYAAAYDGIIDDVAIFNKALTPADIMRLYNYGAMRGIRVVKWQEMP